MGGKLRRRAVRRVGARRKPRLPRIKRLKVIKPRTVSGHRANAHYIPGAPVRTRTGSGFTVVGKVVCARSGRPVANAQVEIWHAGWISGQDGPVCGYSRRADGAYRATLYADANGGFTFNTDHPCLYTNPEHIHLKISGGRWRTGWFKVPVRPDDIVARPTFRLQPAG